MQLFYDLKTAKRLKLNFGNNMWIDKSVMNVNFLTLISVRRKYSDICTRTKLIIETNGKIIELCYAEQNLTFTW